MRTKITLQTGSILELDYTSYNTTFNFIQNLARVIKKDLPNFNLDLANLNDKDLMANIFSVLPNIILNAVMDNQFIQSIFDCADNSKINDERINKEYFEDVNNRKDFFLTLFNVAKYNLTPFFPKANIK